MTAAIPKTCPFFFCLKTVDIQRDEYVVFDYGDYGKEERRYAHLGCYLEEKAKETNDE